MGYIYKIINDINNKIYIGKTENTLNSRWNSHKCECNKCNDHGSSKIHDAMRKYGIEHFKIIQIEECNNNILSEREKYWIKHLKTTNDKYGYNISHGGEGRTIYNREDIYNLWLEGKSIVEIESIINCKYTPIKETLDYYNISEFDRRSRAYSKFNLESSQEILQLYLNTNVTIEKLAKQYKCSIKAIQQILNNNNVDLNYRKNKVNELNKKKVAMLDKNTLEIIKIFNSRKEAAEYVKGNSSPISSGIKTNGIRYGYRWKNIE